MRPRRSGPSVWAPAPLWAAVGNEGSDSYCQVYRAYYADRFLHSLQAASENLFFAVSLLGCGNKMSGGVKVFGLNALALSRVTPLLPGATNDLDQQDELDCDQPDGWQFEILATLPRVECLDADEFERLCISPRHQDVVADDLRDSSSESSAGLSCLDIMQLGSSSSSFLVLDEGAAVQKHSSRSNSVDASVWHCFLRQVSSETSSDATEFVDVLPRERVTVFGQVSAYFRGGLV